MDLLSVINKVIQPVSRRLQNVVQRGTLTLVNDGVLLQELQLRLRADQVREEIEHPTNYGFTHNPPLGSDVVLLSQNGKTEKGFAIVVGDRQFRLQGLKSGEVALYDDQGQMIKLARDGRIEVKANNTVAVSCKTAEVNATTSLTVTSPNSTFTGNVNIQKALTVTGAITGNGGASITGSVAATGDVVAGGVSLKGHTHKVIAHSKTGAPVA